MMNVSDRKNLVSAAQGEDPADIVFQNADLFNPFTGDWESTDFAVKNGIVLGTGTYSGREVHDLRGAPVIPGLIDAHVHVESSLLHPQEYARLVIGHGTTTVIADPHEIANVCGVEGIRFFLREREDLPIDLFVMLPSCVPATPTEQGGGILNAEDLEPFMGIPGVLGLGEMMNVPGVLSGDTEVWKKLGLSRVIDGHAPFLRGKALNAYILSGIQSDHESVSLDEAAEKLAKGMYIFLREGSTERNLNALIPLISSYTVSRCSFATDDRHVVQMMAAGHVDDCVRKAIASGVSPELAFRMATLSASDRFGLTDRGAIAPGRLADFCILRERSGCHIEKTFKKGIPVTPGAIKPVKTLRCHFACYPPELHQIHIHGQGQANVIGVVPNQIVTEKLTYAIDAKEIPDLSRDILKVVVVSRYHPGRIGLGLVHGFGLVRGAIAGSVSHDAHNIIAVGVSDRDIIEALHAVIHAQGGLAAVSGRERTFLPLACAGLMSVDPYEQVAEHLRELLLHTERMNSIPDPFMHLSFLALTVIPHLRVTDRGPFDVDAFRDIPILFYE
jgi:adenine deaminase